MALIVSRAILFLILALAFGIATVFPEQKLPLYKVAIIYSIHTVCSGCDCFECMAYTSKR